MSSTDLLRWCGYAGLVSAVVFCINIGRRAGVVPQNDLTLALAPLPALLACVALLGLFLARHELLGRFGAVAFALNFAGAVLAVAVDALVNWVFAYLPAETVTAVREGATGTVLLVVSVLFLVGTYLFAAALIRARAYPVGAVLIYAVGFTPVALRGVVPVPVFLVGLFLGAAATAWLCWSLLRSLPSDRVPATR